jgi:hypothetical protein
LNTSEIALFNARPPEERPATERQPLYYTSQTLKDYINNFKIIIEDIKEDLYKGMAIILVQVLKDNFSVSDNRHNFSVIELLVIIVILF